MLVVCSEAAEVRKCALDAGLFVSVGRPPLSTESGVGGIAQVFDVVVTELGKSSNIKGRHHLQEVSICCIFWFNSSYHVIFVNQIVAVEHVDTCPVAIVCQNFDGLSWLKQHNIF